MSAVAGDPRTPDTGFTLRVEGIELWGHCGVTDEERAVGQRLIVDIRLVPAEATSLASDELARTVDYGDVVRVVREAVEGAEYRLIERLADEICGRLWRAYALVEAAASVRKPAPPVGLPIGAAVAEVVRRA
jgi:dihydroneopterin aldolase